MSFNLTYSTLTSLEINKIECKYKTTFKLLIPSIMKCLPEGQCIIHHQFDVSTTNLMCIHRNLAVLCLSEPFICLFIVLSKVYDVINDAT